MPCLLVLTQTHNLWGGIETWMRDVFPALERRGWEVNYGLAWGARFNSPELFVREHRYVRRWMPLDGRVGTATARSRAVVGELRRLDPDVIVPIGVGDALPGLRTYRNKRGRARILVPVHSLHVGTLADIKAHRDLIDGVGCVSGLPFHWATAAFADQSPKLFLVRNGVPAPTRVSRRSSSGMFRVGYVGRLDAEIKRSHDLLGIASSLESTGTTVCLRVAGDGAMKPVLEAGFRGMRNPNSYEMLGFIKRERLYEEVYPELDCLILTSVTEGSPLAIIEAMRHGVVPVASRYHGHAADGFLRPERNCLTYPVGDHAAAAACIKRLAESPELHHRLSSTALADAQSCDTNEMVDGWERALRSVLEASKRAPVNRIRPDRNAQGRLEAWGLSATLSDDLRRIFGKQFQHTAGFDEWPGSLSTDEVAEHSISVELAAIEKTCTAQLYC